MKKSVLIIIAIISALGISATTAFAQVRDTVVISPRSIIVNPFATSAYQVDLSSDKGSGVFVVPSYNVGDSFRLNVTVNQDSYIYLFNISSEGRLSQLLPNTYSQSGRDNFVAANTTRMFPSNDSNFRFTIARPLGLEKVIAIASKKALNVTEIASYSNNANFASNEFSEQEFASILSIVLSPLSYTDWVTDTILFNIVDNTPPPAPVYGTLAIESNVNNAAIYIDNVFRGITQLGSSTNLGDTKGIHTLRLEAEGFATFEQVVNLTAGQITKVNAPLRQLSSRGTVEFNSTPSGATVYLNGANIGVTPISAKSFSTGSYTAIFKLAGHADSQANFTLGLNEYEIVTSSMPAVTGSLVFRSAKANSRLYINGDDYGEMSPTQLRTVQNLKEGNYEVTVITPGYTTFFDEIYVTPGRYSEIVLNQFPR